MAEIIRNRELVEKFWDCIPSVWRQTKTRIRSIAFEKYQMGVEQFQVLRRINKGITSVSALAEVAGTGRPSVSRVVDILVKRGFVTRLQNPSDRRKVPLALTSEGQSVLNEIFTEAEAWLENRFQDLNHAQRVTFLEGLDTLKISFTNREDLQ